MTSQFRFKLTRKYANYVDWTTDVMPRPFYVGKGVENRVNSLVRSDHHRAIVAKHGIRREIVFETDDEAECLTREAELVAEHHTYVYDVLYGGIGCNHTKGGEGNSGINAKPVLMCDPDTGAVVREFATVYEAETFVKQALGRLLTGHRKLQDLAGHAWRFKHAEHQLTKRGKYATRANCKHVEIRDGDVVIRRFQSIVDVASFLGIHRMLVSGFIHGRVTLKSFMKRCPSWCHDHLLVLVSDNALTGVGRRLENRHGGTISRALRGHKKSDEHKQKLSKARSKPVTKLDAQGFVVATYPSIRAAQLAEGVSKSTMIDYVHSGKHVKQHTWKFVDPDDARKQGWKMNEVSRALITRSRRERVTRVKPTTNETDAPPCPR